MAAAPPPAEAPHDQHDYEALLCSLLGIHLFPLLDRADKLAVRGVSMQLREEADRCVRSLDCSSELKDGDLERLKALCGRLVGLKSLTLHGLQEVEELVREDGSTAFSSTLEDLAIDLSILDALHLKQSQLDSMVHKTSKWLRKLDLTPGFSYSSQVPLDLSSLSTCTQLQSLNISCQRGVTSLAPLSTLSGLRELRAHYSSVSSIEPLRSCTQLSCLVISSNAVLCLEPIRALTQLTELDLRCLHFLTSLDPISECLELKSLNLHGTRFPSVDALGPLTKLEKLDMGSCTRLTSLSALSSLSRLADLNLSHGRALPASALSPLRSCTALQQVDIRCCNLDLAPLAACHGLRRLYAYTLYAQLDTSQLRGLPNLHVKSDPTRREWLDVGMLS